MYIHIYPFYYRKARLEGIEVGLPLTRQKCLLAVVDPRYLLGLWSALDQGALVGALPASIYMRTQGQFGGLRSVVRSRLRGSRVPRERDATMCVWLC